MLEVRFKIKVITPTCMGGGTTQCDGIRASEIKGIMRYWFRVVAGPVFISVKELSDKIIAINFSVSLRTSFRGEGSRVVFMRNKEEVKIKDEEKGKIEVRIEEENKYTTILKVF